MREISLVDNEDILNNSFNITTFNKHYLPDNKTNRSVNKSTQPNKAQNKNSYGYSVVNLS